MSPDLLHQTLIHTRGQTPEATALITAEGSRYTFREFALAVENLARQFVEVGIAPGDRVGIFLAKGLLACAAPYACSMLGAVFVPINPGMKALQVAHIVRDSGMPLLLTTPERAQNVSEALNEITALRCLMLSEEDTSKSAFARDVAIWKHSHGRDAATMAAAAPQVRGVNRDDLAALLYTSGSSGAPKGVMVSHKNLIVGCQSVSSYLNMTRRDILVAVLPFSFDYGLNQLLSSIYVGATCVLHDFYFAAELLKIVDRYTATGLAGVPTLWNQLAQAGELRAPNNDLRYFTNSGGALPSPVLAKLRRIFPQAEPYLMYGLTEAFRSTYLPPRLIDERAGSIGKAIPAAEILVIKDDGAAAAPGEEGELVHCGELVSLGYWNAPTAQAQRFKPVPGRVLPDGSPEIGVWSGDVVRLDDDGFLYFVGRRDGLIKTSGYRVSPDEIEEVIYALPSIQEACAFGVADDVLGQRIVTALVFRDSAVVDDSALERYCRRMLPSYMVPAEFLIVDSLPKNMNGKPDRRALAEAYNDKSATLGTKAVDI